VAATAIVGGTIWTGDGTVIRDGVLVFDGGRIESVGQGAVPRGAQEVSARGRYVLPGLVDAHSHLGVHVSGLGSEGNDGNEGSEPVTPQVRALDAFYPFDPAIQGALAAGVTAALVTPGSGNVVGGQSAVFRLAGRSADAMALRAPAGIKAALGENPKGYGRQGKAPMTRMGTAALLREALLKARAFAERTERAAGDSTKAPEHDARSQALAMVVRREIPLRIHCHRTDDILTALRIRDEFELDITLEHVTEGYLVAREIAAAAVPCMVGPAFSGRYKAELARKDMRNPVVLFEAGVTVSLVTDHPVQQAESLPWSAAVAMREGMPEQEALRAVSLNPAQGAGVGERIGSLAVGKDADVVVWQGHPFEIRSRVRRTYVAGALVHKT
jgi:imidazolonepropionase-like amidohydrolase